MSARRLALVLAVLALAGLAAFVVALLHRPAQSAVRLAGGPVAAVVTLTPADPQFGDPVVASVEVLVDPNRVDPDSVKLDARVAPYAVTSTSRSAGRAGDVSIVRFTDRLDCLDAACVPKHDVATLRLPRLRVAYSGGAIAVAWPSLRVHARVPVTDLSHPMLRVSRPQSKSSYRVPPGPTGWALIAAALAVGLGGLALLSKAIAALLPRRRVRGGEIERILHELTSANGDMRRRRVVLEQLAGELEGVDEPLSFESRVIAWAPEDPQPAVVSDLARRVRTVVDG